MQGILVSIGTTLFSEIILATIVPFKCLFCSFKKKKNSASGVPQLQLSLDSPCILGGINVSVMHSLDFVCLEMHDFCINLIPGK